MTFRIVKQRARENSDIIGVPCIQDENGNLKMESEIKVGGVQRILPEVDENR